MSTHMPKQYVKRSINGDAGEHLAAFKFTRTLNWPCRLQNVDLGIDAEIEICDDQNSATGNVVKLQIKSFEEIESPEKHDVYVDDADISYWQRFSVPTIVVCVDLSTEKIYWKSINTTEAYQSGGASRKITFDLSKNELTAASKKEIASLSSPDHYKDVHEIILEAKKLHDRITSSAAFAISGEELVHIQSANDEFDLLIARIEEIRRHYPWRISPFSAKEVDYMKANMFRHINDAEVSWRNGINGM